MAQVYQINSPALVTEQMSHEYVGTVVQIEFYDGAGDPVVPVGRARVERLRLIEDGAGWVEVGRFAADDWRFNSPCSRIRLDLSGVSGYDSYRAQAWRTVHTVDLTPEQVFSGFRAYTVQPYSEANVKNGVQYEVSSNVAALAAGANIDTIFITGADPVIIKSRIVKFNGASLLTRVFRGATYTGGMVNPYFNLNDYKPVAGGVVLVAGATVTTTGTEFGAPTYDIGSVDVGNSSLNTFSEQGLERILRPNTVYLQRITNDSGATQRVSGYLSWYEGGTDLPL